MLLQERIDYFGRIAEIRSLELLQDCFEIYQAAPCCEIEHAQRTGCGQRVGRNSRRRIASNGII
jgi:hypothetical protein